MRALLIIYIALFYFQSVYSQGITDGFYKSKGDGNVVVAFGAENFKNYFAGTDKVDLGRSGQYVAIYADYGITDKLSASFSLPYVSNGETKSNLQDFRLLLKGKIKEFKLDVGFLDFGAAVGLSAPVSNYSSGGFGAIGQRATIVENRLISQFKFKSGWFTSLQTGFSYKLSETPSSFPFTLRAGLASSKYYFDIFYDYQYSFGGIDYLGTPSPQNFEELGVDFNKVGGSFYYVLSQDFGATANLAYTLNGRNTFQGPSIGAGLVYNFKK